MAHTIDEPGFAWLFNAAPDALLIVDPKGTIVSANRQAETMFGAPRSGIVGQSVEAFVPERFRSRHRQQRQAYGRKPVLRQMGPGGRFMACRLDGSEFPAEIGLSPLEDGDLGLVLVTLRDITDRQRAEERLFQERERALVTLASIADAVITTDAAGVVDYLNPAAELLTGWTLVEASGRPLEEVLPLVAEESGRPVENPVHRCLRMGQTELTDEVSLQRRDGTLLPLACTVSPIAARSGAAVGGVVVFRDVVEQRRLARQLSHQATHDSLTGLVNRAEFERRLTRAVAGAGGAPATLCYLDLDRFKAVNDSCGHAAGDEVLRQVATLVSGACRQRDTVARLGGDEFVVLFDNCALDEGLRVTSKIQRAVANHRFTWHDRSFHLGVSAGAVPITPGASPEALLLAADAACYTSKAGGGVRVVVAPAVEPAAADPHRVGA